MKQILLLEDLPEIRAWLKALALQVFPDAQISEASRIHDALELVNAVRFDVAMLDLGLPDGSGVEVVQALREKQPEAQSVVVTIHEDDDHLFPALQAGAFGYLLKEQSREQLSEQLQRISQGEPPLSPSIARRVIQYFAIGAPTRASNRSLSDTSCRSSAANSRNASQAAASASIAMSASTFCMIGWSISAFWKARRCCA